MVKLKMARVFFDKPAVLGAVDKATRQVLSRFGAFVRRTARQSIRKRKGISKPGHPPSSHTGLLKQFIFFAYEPSRRSVIIGPEKLTGRVGQTALPALEYGGESTTWDMVSRREHVNDRGVYRVHRGKQYRQIRIQARPYMGPAFAKEKPKMPQMWRDSIR